MKVGQRGAFALGVVVGLLIGLALALGVALFITKAPVPFVNKVPLRTPEQDQAEQVRNRNWDPNAPLAGRGTAKPAPAAREGPAPAASGGVAPVPAASAPGATAAASAAPRTASRDPAAILAGAASPGPAASAARPADPFMYFVQAGAYSRADEAEQQRARLAMLGQSAKLTEREQAGRVVYRVRLGPFETRAEAEALQGKLQESGVEGQLVRVERP